MKIDFDEISAPATRALKGVGIETYEQLADCTKKYLLSLHGFGYKSIRILGARLLKLKLSFKSE